MWPKCRKLVSLKKVTQLLAFVVTILFFYLIATKGNSYILEDSSKKARNVVKEDPCEQLFVRSSDDIGSSHLNLPSSSTYKTRQQILLFLQEPSSPNAKLILYMLNAARIKYHAQYGISKNLPALTDDEKGRYETILFEDAETYLNMNKWNREILEKYCMKYDVGILLFVSSRTKKSVKTLDDQQFGSFPLSYSTNIDIQKGIINPNSQVLRITRSGKQVDGSLGNGWSVFSYNHSTYETILSGSLLDQSIVKNRRIFAKWKYQRYTGSDVSRNVVENFDAKNSPQSSFANTSHPIIIQDTGKYDGIRKVIYGNDLEFWLNKVLFLDTISFLSRGKLSTPLDRYIQVDIDDMFVSVDGLRMRQVDVQKLVEFQDNMRKRVPGFNFLLGYSGKFFGRGTEEEKLGDKMLLQESHNFVWFPHMWSHMQAHLFHNATTLCKYMEPNRQFATRHKFNISTQYAVAPHHSGVFPVHEPLYECWRRVWDIEVTSTEEYPNLRPAVGRRGFIYKGIKVLPRQTCGLFTHTNFLNKYPGGPEKLNAQADGGEVFLTMLLNKYNIYMTHFSNYGSDRLALYLFDRVIKFVQCWTNLRLSQLSPTDMARSYFKDHPEDETPLWSNPCLDPRHLEIWSKNKNCNRLPKFVIVGPQKTGSTALHWFLQMHPDLRTSKRSLQTFEEIQFFNSPNYLNGVDWYMDFFPLSNEDTEVILYEKSANYFNDPLSPQRVHALLPHSQIVILLIDPGKRAYSWYQHMISHDDPTALNFSFQDVIEARSESPPALISLQTHCLIPGRYSEHIEKWLEYFPASQLVFVDGESVAKNPIPVLHKLQSDLNLKNVYNFSRHVKYDAKKGFFCKIKSSGKTDCLGKSKGREYPEMTKKSRLFLENYYKETNKKLLKILEVMRRPIPDWLRTHAIE